MAVITQEQKQVCKQSVREEFARISILNKQNVVISQIEGKTIEGSISITNDSYLKRSANLKLLLNSTLLPNQQSLLWTNKMLKLEIGIKNIITKNIVWFKMGVYLYKSTQIDYSSTDKTISLTLLDKIANFSGDINGILETDLKIANKGVSISEAIRSLVVQIGGENSNNVLIENIVDDSNNILSLPYTLTANRGDKILDSLKVLIELYKNWTIYYDTDGNFICEKLKTLLTDAISEDFRDIDFTINSQITNSFDYIKNYVKVYGISVQPTVSVEDTGSTTNPTPNNNSAGLKILFNKPLYDSSGNRLSTGQNVKSYFQYDGTSSNYISATYNDSDWSVVFVINGENGKILKPIANMIYDAYEIPFDDGGYVYSTIDIKWSRILVASVITDGINNQIQFQLNFNKPLYKNGSLITTNTDLKSSFYYSDGSGSTSNFISAIYMSENNDYYVTLNFANAVTNATIQINKDSTQNSNSIYDSSGLIYRTENYIMNGTTWTKIQDDSSLVNTYQISAEITNTDDSSPYSVNNLGEKRILIINDTNIYTKSQALSRSTYELQIHSNLNETINLSTLSLYWMDTNMLLYLYESSLGIDGKYRVDKVNFDLKSGVMQLSLVKLYM